MEAKAWHGGTYGIRVGRKNAEEFFSKNWRHIEVEIDGRNYSFMLSSTFWTNCPEFRGAVIENWLRKRKLLPWSKGRPPKVDLAPLGGNRFRLLKRQLA